MEDEEIISFMKGLLVGCLIVFALLGGYMIIKGCLTETLSENTINDICVQLTGNENAIGYGYSDIGNELSNKLVCEIPSYDATQNIIIKLNSEKK